MHLPRAYLPNAGKTTTRPICKDDIPLPRLLPCSSFPVFSPPSLLQTLKWLLCLSEQKAKFPPPRPQPGSGLLDFLLIFFVPSSSSLLPHGTAPASRARLWLRPFSGHSPPIFFPQSLRDAPPHPPPGGLGVKQGWNPRICPRA